MAGLSDILIHEYFQVDFEVVWQVIKNDIPLANEWINYIIEEEKLSN
jgi:uncharacterized protein with HEPN domain